MGLRQWIGKLALSLQNYGNNKKKLGWKHMCMKDMVKVGKKMLVWLNSHHLLTSSPTEEVLWTLLNRYWRCIEWWMVLNHPWKNVDNLVNKWKWTKVSCVTTLIFNPIKKTNKFTHIETCTQIQNIWTCPLCIAILMENNNKAQQIVYSLQHHNIRTIIRGCKSSSCENMPPCLNILMY